MLESSLRGQGLALQVLTQPLGLMLLSLFGGIALLLAAVGLYGVISFSVGQRTREFGIRIALGAEGPGIMCSVLAGGARLAGTPYISSPNRTSAKSTPDRAPQLDSNLRRL